MDKRALVSNPTPSHHQGRFIGDCIVSVATPACLPSRRINRVNGCQDGTLDVLGRPREHVRWVSQ